LTPEPTVSRISLSQRSEELLRSSQHREALIAPSDTVHNGTEESQAKRQGAPRLHIGRVLAREGLKQGHGAQEDLLGLLGRVELPCEITDLEICPAQGQPRVPILMPLQEPLQLAVELTCPTQQLGPQRLELLLLQQDVL